MSENNKSKNFYYIGTRLSDIATTFDANTTDAFFKGSITCYGTNTNGNIAYNVMSGMQLSDNDVLYGNRNSAIYRKFIGEQCRKIVAVDSDAMFLAYSISYAMKVPKELQSRVCCANDPDILSFLNSKFNFKKLIDGKIPQAKFEFMKGCDILQLIKSGEIPNNREVVIQSEYGAGGEGTIIATKKMFADPKFMTLCKKNIKPNQVFVVSEYIENICSVSIHIQLTNNEIAIYPPTVQFLRGPCFIGSDLFAFNQLSDDVKQECTSMARTFGNILRNIGDYIDVREIKEKKLRGYFGLDVIVAKSGKPRVFAIETNPRFTGTTGLMNILCHKAGIGSVFEHSWQAFYADETNLVKQFKKITPVGRKTYAMVARDKGGNVITPADNTHNLEGLDETVYQEDGFYTYAIFDEARNYNVFDERKKDKKYASDYAKRKK